MTVRPRSIKDAGYQAGGGALTMVELPWGDLPVVSKSRRRGEGSILTGRQKSAEGLRVTQVAKARTVLRKQGHGRGEYKARLMSARRQTIQLVLAFSEERRSEAPMVPVEGTESLAAKRTADSPAMGEPLREPVGAQELCERALARVKAQKGTPGVEWTG